MAPPVDEELDPLLRSMSPPSAAAPSPLRMATP
eukprot:CAMPEP_0184079588 /NCGR_PEP_ID=MMETSP0974-20121125/1756_1 /TAXON_ID=483370 /ORGANISM="non described non described, Strain CCMP2097" /LENGTH=32 /DNA_ID= /DNA_START= /DNA_END= /DNA_ORIENTATION=